MMLVVGPLAHTNILLATATGVLQERKFRAEWVCVRGNDSSGFLPLPVL